MELLLKLLHIGLVSFWLAGALYLPQLFRWYRSAPDERGREPMIAMARRIYFVIMTPAAIVAVILGSVLVFFGFEGGWLPVKLSLVLLLVLFHLYCGRVLLKIEKKQRIHGPAFLGSLTLIPLPLFAAIVALAVAKPF